MNWAEFPLSALFVASASALAFGADSGRPPFFVDVSEKAQLSFLHAPRAESESWMAKFMVITMGSGGGFFDYDNDGRLDVYLVNGVEPNRLFRNRADGSFADVTGEAGVGDTSYGMGCAFADYDNDGFQDIYVSNLGPNVLYRNNGDGTFSDVSTRAGVGDPLWSTSVAFGDYDRDGHVDLYVCNYLKFSFASHRNCYFGDIPIYCYPHSYDGVPNTLYRNRGDGTFRDVTARAGLREAAEFSKGLGVIWLDFDRDGDPDLFVANDTTANYLFENQGDGTFEDVSLVSGTSLSAMGVAQSGMGVDAADLDGKGRFHVIVTNYSLQNNALYWNEGFGLFSDRIVRTRLAGPGFVPLGFGVNFFDYDNDGFPDLFVANGHVLEQAATVNASTGYRQPNQLFRNAGEGLFEEVSSQAGDYFKVENVSRGSAVGDFNNDGRLDLLVSNNGGKADLLENRTGSENNWIKLKLEGTHCNRNAIGAKVFVDAGGVRQLQEVRAGSSYLSQSDLRIHFGLGKATRMDSIRVDWPCGNRTRIPAPGKLNRILEIREE